MKGISKFYAALFTFAFGVILTMSWFSCQTAFSQRVSDDKVVEQTNVEPTPTPEETKSENDETACLNVEYPKGKSKYIISFGVINGKAIDIPKPEYPEAARVAKVSGAVQVSVLIDEQGEVAWGRIETGHPLLQAAVRKVVCQARFKPTTLSGKPVTIRGFIVYKFIPS
jgi:TonB family protein